MLSHIRKVYVEFQAQCNRFCAWCPNKDNNREYKEMDDFLYTKILNELVDNGFGKNIFGEGSVRMSGPFAKYSSFALLGYNEPFLNIPLLKRRVEEAYDKLSSDVLITTATNGDFLTRDSLKNLYLSTLLVNDYDNKGMEYWKAKMKEIGAIVININEQRETIEAIHSYVGLIICECNWTKNHLLENRGGTLNNSELSDMKWKNNMSVRTIPCIEPDYCINIDYNGNLMPCCHMRADTHEDFCFGNIRENHITDIFFCDKAEDFKKTVHDCNNLLTPCKYCQKIRYDNYSGAPNGFVFEGEKYRSNIIDAI